MAYWLSRLIVLCCVFLACKSVAHAERRPITPDRIAELDRFVETRMAELKVPGVAIALIEEGEIVHARGFGVIAQDGAMVSADTRFQVGSVSKPLITLLVLSLAEQGQLNLDDPIVEHIPWFQTKDKTRSDKMTIRHLLSHRSGLTTGVGNRNQTDTSQATDAFERTTRELKSVSLHSDPGARYMYSNANFQTLGLIIEAVSQSPLEKVFEDYIGGLGLSQTRLGPSSPDETIAIGHRYWFGHPTAFDSTNKGRVLFPQGTVETSVSNMASILALLIKGFQSPNPDPRLIDMITPEETGPGMNYALGWMTRDFPNHRLVFHNGRNPGFEAVAGFSPDQQFGFVVFANASADFAWRDVSSLTSGVGNLVMGLEPLSAETPLLKRMAAWAFLLLPFVLIGLASGFVRKWRAEKLEPLRVNAAPVLWRVILPSVLLLGLAWLLYFTLPARNGANLATAKLFNPDIGYLFQISAVLAFGWGLIRPVLRLTLAKGR